MAPSMGTDPLARSVQISDLAPIHVTIALPNPVCSQEKVRGHPAVCEHGERNLVVGDMTIVEGQSGRDSLVLGRLLK